MRVKHKDEEKNNPNKSMALCAWYKDYYPNKKYLNYEFYDVPDIFDLYEKDEKTGNLIYIKSDFASQIKHYARENPTKYLDKPHDSKYLDEYLMPSKLAYQLSLELNNNSIKPTNIKTNAKPVKQFKIKENALKFWVLISENKLISGIVLFLIILAIKTIFNISL